MTRGLQHPELELADAVAIAFARGLRIHDLTVGIRAVKDFGARQVGKNRGTRNEILVAVGLKDMRDLEALGPGLLDINFAVAAGIDDSGLSARADQIGKV